MEIYDKTHIKLTDSKEENKTQKPKKEINFITEFCPFMYLSYLKELS